jgi:integrase
MDYKKEREEYVKDLSPSLQRAYKLLFTKIDYYQKRNGIIFEEMDENQFITFTIKELIDQSAASANVKVNLLRKYTNAIGKDFVKLNRDDIIKLTESKLGNDNTNENELRYVVWKDLKKGLENVENDIDKAIVCLIRIGLCGTKFTELVNLKSKDIDIENRKIYLESRTVDIADDYVLNILNKALRQTTYKVITHKDEDILKVTEYNFNMQCEYFVKQRPITKNENGLNPYKFAGITGKMYRIFEELGMNISSINLLQSNAVDRLIEYEDAIGKQVSMAEAKEYLKAVGITNYHYDVVHLSKYVREKYGR